MVRALSDQMLTRGLLKNPLTHLGPGTVAYYRITPQLIRFGDFSHGYGDAAVFTEITV
jgi:hypothetical protein